MSSVIDDQIYTNLFSNGTDESRARLTSLTAPTTSMYLAPVTHTAVHLHLTAAEFRCTVRFRLGQPITHEVTLCRQCLKTSSDTAAYHSLTCMKGGFRTRAHNAIRDCLYGMASFGLCYPRREWPAVPQSAARLDLVLPMRGRLQLCDIALTHALRQTHLSAAAATASGAATAYEAIKRREYGHLVDNRISDLVPIVFDTFGGLGASGRPLINYVVNQAAQRCEGVRSGRAHQLSIIHRCVIRHIARLMLLNA